MIARLLLLATALTLGACSAAEPKTTDLVEAPAAETKVPDAKANFQRNDYADTVNWLCHPGKTDDACGIDLTATEIAADGSTSIIPYEAAAAPEIDCFYLYPTVSEDESDNSDMLAGPEELSTISNQFARYGAACRLYAPIYRQRTMSALRKGMTTGGQFGDPELRWADIEDSWNTYMRDHNDGRGVVLVGHSQGAGILYEMLDREIIGKPLQEQIIAVHSIGTTRHADVGADSYKGMPLCTAGDQTGCIVTYVSFRETSPPPEAGRFGLVNVDARAICVNPATLSGDDGALDAYMPTKSMIFGDSLTDYGPDITTPYVKLPGLLTAACERTATHDWLSVTVNGNPDDPRIDDISGDVIVGGQILKDWGLHLIDMNIAMGNLVRLADTQGQAWRAAQADE